MKISNRYLAILFFTLTLSVFGMTTPFVVQAQALDTASTCGNAKLEGTEACDDGNTADKDGCDNQCLREIADGVCGNGTIDKTEQCDDGNNTSGDNCTADCKQEFCHVYDNTTTPPTVTSYFTTLDTAYYAGVACLATAQPQPVANTNPVGEATLTCTSGEAATEGLCVVDKDSQIKCFTKNANAEIITLGTIIGTVTDIEKVGTDNILVVATADNGISLVNTIKQEVMQHLTFEQAGAVKSLAISKNYGYILNEDKILKTDELRTADVFTTFTAEEKAPLALAATLDDDTLYALLADGSIKAWMIDSTTGTMKEEYHAGVTSLTNAAAFTTGDIVVMATPDLTKTGSYKKTVLIADAANKQIVQIADLAYQAKAEVIIKDLPFAPDALTVDKDEVLVTDKDLAEKLYTIDKTFKVTEHTLTGIAKPDKTVTAQLCGFAEIDMLPPVKTPVCDENSLYNPDSGKCECTMGYSRQLDPVTAEPACLPTVVLEATCPEFSTLSDAGKCQCNTGYMGSLTTDADGKSILTCTASTTSVDPIKKDPSDLTPINPVNSADPLVKDPSNLAPAKPIDTLKTCPDGLTYSDVTLKCECPTGYKVVALNNTLTCEVVAKVAPMCPENSFFDTLNKRCECTKGYIMQALDQGIACVETVNFPDSKAPVDPSVDECLIDKTLWDNDLADCVCEEGLVAIRDCDGVITRCIDPKDPCGCHGDNTTMTNTTITNTNTNTNTNNTNVNKVINIANTDNNTNTKLTPVNGTQKTPTPSSSNSPNTTPSTTPSSSVSSSSNSGSSGNSTSSGNSISSGSSNSSSSSSFTDAVNNTFTPATATADSAGDDSVDETIDVGVNSDPGVSSDATEDPSDGGTNDDEIKDNGGVTAGIEGGALACSLTQTGTGTSHHEGFLGLMVLMVLASLRLVNARINQKI